MALTYSNMQSDNKGKDQSFMTKGLSFQGGNLGGGTLSPTSTPSLTGSKSTAISNRMTGQSTPYTSSLGATRMGSFGNAGSLNVPSTSSSITSGMAIAPAGSTKPGTLLTGLSPSVASSVVAPKETASATQNANVMQPVTPTPETKPLMATQPPATPATPAAPVTPPSPVTPPTTAAPTQEQTEYAKALDEAQNLRNQAAKFSQIVQQSQQAIMANPNYSLDTKVGLASRIPQTYGLIGQNLLAQAESAQRRAESIKPAVTSFGQTVFEPYTGTFAGGGAGGVAPGSEMDKSLDLYANMAASGQISAVPSSITSNPVLNAELTRRAQAINKGYSPVTSEAMGSSAANLTGQKAQLQSIFNGVDANYKLLLNTAEQGQVNQGNVPVINQLQQNVARGLASNEAVINFRNTLAAVRAAYAQILGGGTSTEGSQGRAQQAIPDDISLDALRSLGEQLKSESTNRITGIQSQIDSLLGKGGTSATTGATTGGKTGSATWDTVANP